MRLLSPLEEAGGLDYIIILSSLPYNIRVDITSYKHFSPMVQRVPIERDRAGDGNTLQSFYSFWSCDHPGGSPLVGVGEWWLMTSVAQSEETSAILSELHKVRLAWTPDGSSFHCKVKFVQMHRVNKMVIK